MEAAADRAFAIAGTDRSIQIFYMESSDGRCERFRSTCPSEAPLPLRCAGTQEPMVRRLFLEGSGFEPLVPRHEKWSIPSSSDQTRGGRTLTLDRLRYQANFVGPEVKADS